MYTNTNPKKRWSFKSIAGTLAVGGMIIAPFVSSIKSNTNVAYKNDANQPSICFGHTKNVKMTDSVSDEQCRKFLEDDYTDAITFVIQQSPNMVGRTYTLKAASLYVFDSGKQSYVDSPMLAHFKQNDWVKGCNAFLGYNIHYRYKFKKLGGKCVQQKDKVWLCEEPDLVAKRVGQKKMCLTSNQ